MTKMVYASTSSQQYANSPCWTLLNETLRERLGWLHFSSGCDDLAPAEAAEQFSNIVGDLLMEYGITEPPCVHGWHRPRRIETTLQNLSALKKNSHKNLPNSKDFLYIFRAHNKVLKCFRSVQNSKDMCKNEREFRHNPWEYAHAKL